MLITDSTILASLKAYVREGAFPAFSSVRLRSLLEALLPRLTGCAQGQVTQNAGTNVQIPAHGFVPKFVVVWNATTSAFHIGFASLGGAKSVNLWGNGTAVAANGITFNADHTLTLGSGIGANAAVLHYFVLGL